MEEAGAPTPPVSDEREGYNGLRKGAADGLSALGSGTIGTAVRTLATVTPYLSQCSTTVESASGESWGRLARTSAAARNHVGPHRGRRG